MHFSYHAFRVRSCHTRIAALPDNFNRSYMSDSLRDQLLKSGLVQKLKSEARPKPATQLDRREARRPPPPKKSPPPVTVRPEPHEHDLARAYALRARQEKGRASRARATRGRACCAGEAGAQAETRGTAGRQGAELGRRRCAASFSAWQQDPPRLLHSSAADTAQPRRARRRATGGALSANLVDKDVAVQAQADPGAESLVLLCEPNAQPEDDDVPADLVW